MKRNGVGGRERENEEEGKCGERRRRDTPVSGERGDVCEGGEMCVCVCVRERKRESGHDLLIHIFPLQDRSPLMR